MKRDEMILKIMEMLVHTSEDLEEAANDILTGLEKAGMKPPSVSEEDCQALMTVYYAGYTFNQWDEDLEKDEKVQVVKKRRAEWNSKTLEEKKAIRKANAHRRSR